MTLDCDLPGVGIARLTAAVQRSSSLPSTRSLGDARDLRSEVVEHHCEQALALTSVVDMRPLVAHCHLGLGKLYRRAGDPAKAHEHLISAVTMYREMEMGFWLEKAADALKEAGNDSPAE